MHLKEFSLISPVIEAVEVFSAIQTAIPADAIAKAVGQTDSVEERQRKLPSHLVVCLVITMSLWSSDSMQTVLKKLVNGLSTQWIRLAQYWRVPNSASISEARQRVGCQVMSQLFHQVVRPLTTPQTLLCVSWWIAPDGSRRNGVRRARQ